MTSGKCLVILGMIVFGCSATAYQMDPGQGPVVLLMGALGGGLTAMFGFLLMHGSTWAYRAGFIMATICLMLGLAMSFQHWSLVLNGGKDFITPIMDGVMVLAAGATLWVLKKNA
jgi:hypothetical protein